MNNSNRRAHWKIARNFGKLSMQKVTIPKSALLLTITVLVMRIASGPTANLSYFLLAAYAITGRAQAIQALFLSWLITLLSPGLAPVASLGAVGRYAIIAGAALSILMRFRATGERVRFNKMVLTVLLLGLFFVIHSIMFSPIVDVSILKSVSFIIVFATLISAWSALSPIERLQTEAFVFYGMVGVLLASLPLVATGLGYLRNGTGFQGILNHPQAMGPFAALLTAWLSGRFLGQRRLPLWQIAILGLALVVVVLSEARTAGGAVVLGVGLPLMFILVFKRRTISRVLPGFASKRTIMVLWAGGLALLIFSAVIFAQLDNYILKSGRSTGTNLSEALEASRGFLVERMIDNINAYPMTGIGFGIGSYPDEMTVQRDRFTGLPLGASIEKGVMPIAIVEEMGIPGAIIVFSWMWMLIRRAFRNGFVTVVVITTALLTNLGESMFFSAGGMGLLLMILVSWAASVPKGNIGKGASQWPR